MFLARNVKSTLLATGERLSAALRIETREASSGYFINVRGKPCQMSAKEGEREKKAHERNVDELVESTRSEESGIDLVRSVRRTNDEHVLLGVHAVHLGQDLVQDAVARASGVAASASAARLRDRVELVKEHDDGRGRSGLVEHVADVRLGLSEPHGQQLGTLDRDKVRLALVRDRLGEQRLSRSGRAVEQDTLRRRHAVLEELFRVLDRVLHRLLQLDLDLVEASDVVPRDGRDLDDRLAQGRRVRRPEREPEVVHRDAERVEHLGVDRVLVEVDQVHLFADLLHRRLGAERRDIGADVPVRVGRDLFQVDVVGELHVLGVDPQRFESARRVGDSNVDLAVEPAEPAQGGIDRVGSVRRRHDDNVGTRLHPVHERQELRNDSTFDFSVRLN